MLSQFWLRSEAKEKGSLDIQSIPHHNARRRRDFKETLRKHRETILEDLDTKEAQNLRLAIIEDWRTNGMVDKLMQELKLGPEYTDWAVTQALRYLATGAIDLERKFGEYSHQVRLDISQTLANFIDRQTKLQSSYLTYLTKTTDRTLSEATAQPKPPSSSAAASSMTPAPSSLSRVVAQGTTMHPDVRLNTGDIRARPGGSGGRSQSARGAW